jgi:uncharacterized repeat protein (TIGR03803 family)
MPGEQGGAVMITSSQPHAKLRLSMLGLLAAVFALGSLPLANAQTFQVLYNFTGGLDGTAPIDGLTIDRNGNLYGTTSAGGHQVSGCSDGYGFTGCGGVFELERRSSGWIFKPLYEFQGGNDSGNPGLGVTIGPDGALYGLTANVFRLQPPPTFCTSVTCPWRETILYHFPSGPDGAGPSSRLIFDSPGNMYGVTFFGGQYNDGSVYELSPSGGTWNENTIYSFNHDSQGYGVYFPGGQLAIDPSGNLYGSAACNTNLSCFYGAVWQLQPSQSGWNLNEIYQFNGYNGYSPEALIRDSSGNLFGATNGDGARDSAAVYELTPSNGQWNYSELYNYGGFGDDTTAALTMDSAGNLYGANAITGYGSIFELTPTSTGWTATTLHTFNGSDGGGATGTIVIDSDGNLYGTTIKGGLFDYGVIWEITP